MQPAKPRPALLSDLTDLILALEAVETWASAQEMELAIRLQGEEGMREDARDEAFAEGERRRFDA